MHKSKKPVSVRLEVIVQSIDSCMEDEKSKIVLALCDFPKILIQPRSGGLAGCGKSCEFELQRIAFLTEVPLWVSLVTSISDGNLVELASGTFDLFTLM